MKERPILFSAPMVRALLDGTKTQTRRVVKITHRTPGLAACLLPSVGAPRPRVAAELCPYGQPGDRLYVRETFSALESFDFFNPAVPEQVPSFWYWADGEPEWGDWTRPKPSIHMPRRASRIDLEITGVRVERLQDISEADADAEGCERLDSERDVHDWKLCPQCGGTRLYTAYAGGGALPDSDCMQCDTYVKRYRHLWDSINGADVPLLDADGNKVGMQPNRARWDANPWVWVVEFKRIKP